MQATIYFSLGKAFAPENLISSILVMLSGVALGFFLMLLFYIYACLITINKKTRVKKGKKDKQSDVERVILSTLEIYKTDKVAKKEHGQIGFAYTLSKQLAYDITTLYFPKSKKPYLELTIDETILFASYVAARIDEMMSAKIFSLFRGLTLKRIDQFRSVKSEIDDSKLAGAAPLKAYSKTRLFNPLYWIKTLTFDKLVDKIFDKIGFEIIKITGEETYKIYSKKMFNNDMFFETDKEFFEELYSQVNLKTEKGAK